MLVAVSIDAGLRSVSAGTWGGFSRRTGIHIAALGAASCEAGGLLPFHLEPVCEVFCPCSRRHRHHAVCAIHLLQPGSGAARTGSSRCGCSQWHLSATRERCKWALLSGVPCRPSPIAKHYADNRKSCRLPSPWTTCTSTQRRSRPSPTPPPAATASLAALATTTPSTTLSSSSRPLATTTPSRSSRGTARSSSLARCHSLSTTSSMRARPSNSPAMSASSMRPLLLLPIWAASLYVCSMLRRLPADAEHL